MDLFQIIDPALNKLPAFLQLAAHKDQTRVVDAEPNKVGTLVRYQGVIVRFELYVALLNLGHPLLDVVSHENAEVVVRDALGVNFDVVAFVEGLEQDLVPFVGLAEVLDADDDHLDIGGEFREDFGDCFGGFPGEDVDPNLLSVEVLGLALFEFGSSVEFGEVLAGAEEEVDDLHFVEIPKILVVEPRHCFVLMFEIAQKPSFTISCDTKLCLNTYSV